MHRTLALFAALSLAATTAQAQTSVNQTNTVSHTVGDVVKLTLDAAATTLATPSNAFDAADSYDATGSVGVTIASNRPWDLKVSSTGYSAQPTGSTKAIGDLKVAVSGESALTGGSTVSADVTTATGLSSTNLQIASGSRGRFAANVDYSFTVNITDIVGTYTADVVYTLTGN